MPADTLEMVGRAELTIFSTELGTYEFVGKLHDAAV